MEQLQDLAFGHAGGGVGQDFQDLELVGVHRQGQGFGQEEVPHQDDGLVTPDGVGGGDAPAHGGGVHHVVMEQGSGVKVLEDGGEVGEVIAPAAAQAGGQEEQQRAHPFAAAQQDMPSHFGYERHVGLEVGHQRLIDGVNVSFQILEDIFTVLGEHLQLNKIT